MRGSERSLWNYIRKGLRGLVDLQRHEDRYSQGIPDVSYGMEKVNGWIELKYRRTWPVKPETPVKCSHFTQSQKRWLKRRGRTGGRCFVIWQIQRDYFLFDWRDVDLIGSLPGDRLKALSIKHWKGTIAFNELFSYMLRWE